VEEILKPIEKQVNGIQFRVLNPDINEILVYTPHPHYLAYQDVHHDPKIFAKDMIGYYGAVVNNAHLHGCSNDTELNEMIMKRWEEEVASDPELWSGAICWAGLLLHKI
jgi:hypothetical protein